MIERIIIENFKSIRKLDLELKPINILIGANGAGKSNFLSFFELTKKIYEQRFQEYIGNKIDKFLYFGRKKSRFFSGLIDFNNTYSITYRIKPFSSSVVSGISEFSVSQNTKKQNSDYDNWKCLYANTYHSQETHLDKTLIEELERTKRIEESKIVKLINENLSILTIYHFHDTGESSPLKKINKLDDNDFLKDDGANLASFLYYLQEKHPREFRNIENQIRSVASFFDRYNLNPRKLNEEEIRLRWFEKGSDNYFDAYDLSDGTLRFMALTILLMQPELPKTIIIDEPELGLHPFAINKLAAMMKQAAAKGSQVIVSTQSTDLVNNFEPEDVVAVDREDNQSVFKRLDENELENWLEDYTLGELWNKNVFGARP